MCHFALYVNHTLKEMSSCCHRNGYLIMPELWLSTWRNVNMSHKIPLSNLLYLSCNRSILPLDVTRTGQRNRRLVWAAQGHAAVGGRCSGYPRRYAASTENIRAVRGEDDAGKFHFCWGAEDGPACCRPECESLFLHCRFRFMNRRALFFVVTKRVHSVCEPA